MTNQEELQKAFMAYLIQDAAAQGIQLQSEQDLEAYAQQLGEEGIKAKYQEFMQKMQGGVMARLGAKLEYYKKLKGVCPEGEELVYFRRGGRICKACQKAQKGSKVKKATNEVDKFKSGRAQYKKDMKSAKDEAAKDSVSINKYNDQETMANKGHKGNFKKGKWVPDRKKYVKENKCGSKMKRHQLGGPVSPASMIKPRSNNNELMRDPRDASYMRQGYNPQELDNNMNMRIEDATRQGENVPQYMAKYGKKNKSPFAQALIRRFQEMGAPSLRGVAQPNYRPKSPVSYEIGTAYR